MTTLTDTKEVMYPGPGIYNWVEFDVDPKKSPLLFHLFGVHVIYEHTHDSCTLHAMCLKKRKPCKNASFTRLLREITRLENARGECTPTNQVTKQLRHPDIYYKFLSCNIYWAFTNATVTPITKVSKVLTCGPAVCTVQRKHELVFAVFIISLKLDARLGAVLNYGL